MRVTPLKRARRASWIMACGAMPPGAVTIARTSAKVGGPADAEALAAAAAAPPPTAAASPLARVVHCAVLAKAPLALVLAGRPASAGLHTTSHATVP